ncbi:MAG: hypothetical protein AB7I18_06005 [Candidatus Berkiella sp.]
MSNTLPKLFLIATLSFSATCAMADSWKRECQSLSSGSSGSSGTFGSSAGASSGAPVPGACSEIEKTIAILDVYAPPQPFLNLQEGQTFKADEAASSTIILQQGAKGSSSGGSGAIQDQSDEGFTMGQ